MPAKIAIFIDAENVDPSFAAQIFSYARSLGEVTVREIYGSGIALNEWADAILENTIHTNFTLRPNRFKNSSDIALTIGAMEMLLRCKEEKTAIDAAVLVSSDSDFSPLAFHLRASGIDVIGMGEPGRINPMWPKACTEFVELASEGPLVRKRELTSPPFTLPANPIPEMPEAPSTPAMAAKPTGSDAQPMEEQPASKAKEPAAPEPVKKIASSHTARVDIIRRFISDQLAAHNGRMKSGTLFKALSALPDYRYDQQRSKRKPLDYLDRQFAEWFKLEPGDRGSYWVSVRTAAAPVTPIDAPEAEEMPAAEEIPAETAQEAPLSEGEQALLDAGIPMKHVSRVASILSECKNLRDTYNRLRQAFGSDEGKKYHELIKAAFAPLAADTPEESETEEQQQEEEQEAANLQDAEQTRFFPAEEEAPPEHKENEITGQQQFLMDRGVQEADAAKVWSIVSGCPNLRIAYNELRKAFGNDGRKYLSLVKEYNRLAES